jgi:hypothetical protein
MAKPIKLHSDAPSSIRAKVVKALRKPKLDKISTVEELKRFKDARSLVRITNTKRPEPERWYVYGTDWELTPALVKQINKAEVRRNKGYWSDCVYYSATLLFAE